MEQQAMSQPRTTPPKPLTTTPEDPVWFVFGGLGSEWSDAGRQLLQLPRFARIVDNFQQAYKDVCPRRAQLNPFPQLLTAEHIRTASSDDAQTRTPAMEHDTTTRDATSSKASDLEAAKPGDTTSDAPPPQNNPNTIVNSSRWSSLTWPAEDDEDVVSQREALLDMLLRVVGMEVCMVDYLGELGVHPAGAIGHGVGDVACAYALQRMSHHVVVHALIGLAYCAPMDTTKAVVLVSASPRHVMYHWSREFEVVADNSPFSCSLLVDRDRVSSLRSAMDAAAIDTRTVDTCGSTMHVPEHARDVEQRAKAFLDDPAHEALARWCQRRHSRWLCVSRSTEEHYKMTCTFNDILLSMLRKVEFYGAASVIPPEATALDISASGMLTALTRESRCRLFVPPPQPPYVPPPPIRERSSRASIASSSSSGSRGSGMGGASGGNCSDASNRSDASNGNGGGSGGSGGGGNVHRRRRSRRQPSMVFAPGAFRDVVVPVQVREEGTAQQQTGEERGAKLGVGAQEQVQDDGVRAEGQEENEGKQQPQTTRNSRTSATGMTTAAVVAGETVTRASSVAPLAAPLDENASERMRAEREKRWRAMAAAPHLFVEFQELGPTLQVMARDEPGLHRLKAALDAVHAHDEALTRVLSQQQEQGKEKQQEQGEEKQGEEEEEHSDAKGKEGEEEEEHSDAKGKEGEEGLDREQLREPMQRVGSEVQGAADVMPGAHVAGDGE
ncbi:hypothetical protein PTSG_02636 [Salpingoeca rosetta]|uniref:Malonyl-CoA:ACP transacylase (MAT) domain-containing protein n=1 Tax=Salpingoeca rosetta (strain ATCC 50818 / BSB-021) TaxID=946362 RepID=F2U2V7_SALR5|nr:uncharacterized protein PTSG_02636 [Salpingoeca rosetta]EGD81951.1 hypothetical protein PTSG_02636 [Salpingoeca rosetta]|eukprot:XP_004996134.1 hypothetical protein PTSG_02636 [Salpingoeca rosetta]